MQVIVPRSSFFGYDKIICLLMVAIFQWGRISAQKINFSDNPDQENRLSFQNRVPAEWERADMLVLVWQSYFQTISKLAHFAQFDGKVLIICADSNAVIKYFQKQDFQTSNLFFLQIDFNTPWIRDYGPVNLYLDKLDSLILVDFLYNRKRNSDDLIPLNLAKYSNLKIMQMNSPSKGLVQIGGNFMTDGMGSAFSSRLLVGENEHVSEQGLRQLFQNYMGISQYVLFDTLHFDIIHHIDMHMKLVNEETMLVGKFPYGMSDQPVIDKNVNYLTRNFHTPFGNKYRIVDIPMPDDFGRFADSTGWADYLTYTNSLIFNQTVFVPIYGIESDKMALAIYKQIFPAYKIIGIDVSEPIMHGGALHCLSYTMAAPVSEYLWISNPVCSDTSIFIKALALSPFQVKHIDLFYRAANEKKFSKKTFAQKNDSSVFFYIEVPVATDCVKMEYYVQAKLDNKYLMTRPFMAPDFYFTEYLVLPEFESLRLRNDTFIWNGGNFELLQLAPGLSKDFIFFWKSLDDITIKDASSLDASVRLKAYEKDFVYSFRLTVFNGRSILYHDFFVNRMAGNYELRRKR